MSLNFYLKKILYIYMEEPQVIIIYKTYSEAQKRANKKYANNNRDKINNNMKKYYNKKKETDPDYLEKKGVNNQEKHIIKKNCYLKTKTIYFN